MKPGKSLGGKPPRRGARLARQHYEPDFGPGRPQILTIFGACLLVGLVAGFAWGMDRQLRGGILDQREEAMARPDWVPIESLPDYVPQAFLAVVDPVYLEGGPVRVRDEHKSMPRELVREIHMLNDGITGQAKELMMAPVLERRTSRREILELYLNRVHLGNSEDYPVYGVYHAAREYLGKEPEDLTLAEAAVLAGLLLEPRVEEPESRAGAVGIRRNEVLQAMLSAGSITPAEYQTATAERLPFQPGLGEMPMTRALLAPADTAVIRLPPEYSTEPNQPAE